jgi:hypothetical protein
LAQVLLNRDADLRSRADLMRQVLYRAIDLTVATLIFTVFVGG